MTGYQVYIILRGWWCIAVFHIVSQIDDKNYNMKGNFYRDLEYVSDQFHVTHKM
jgi:hypothetical protein